MVCCASHLVPRRLIRLYRGVLWRQSPASKNQGPHRAKSGEFERHPATQGVADDVRRDDAEVIEQVGYAGGHDLRRRFDSGSCRFGSAESGQVDRDHVELRGQRWDDGVRAVPGRLMPCSSTSGCPTPIRVKASAAMSSPVWCGGHLDASPHAGDERAWHGCDIRQRCHTIAHGAVLPA